MKIKIIALIFLLSPFLSIGQGSEEETEYVKDEKSKPRFAERLYVTGNVNFSFGTYTILGGNPSVGYKITDNFSAGVGTTFFYFKVQGYQGHSIYGGNLFLKQILFDVAFLQAEYHLMNVQAYNSGQDYSAGSRITIPMLYFGGGYRHEIGSNVYLIGQMLWDVIDHQESPFFNPYISGGISVGL